MLSNAYGCLMDHAKLFRFALLAHSQSGKLRRASDQVIKSDGLAAVVNNAQLAPVV